MRRSKTTLYLLTVTLIAVAIGYFVGFSLQDLNTAQAAGGVVTGPNVIAPERYVYYPGTEALEAGEIRVIACGTGMPDQRLSQASACFLFELGNGDKFIFDIGTGSAERISAMKIPYNYIDKVFIGHLHSDHFGDLDALWIGGVVANRVVPLRVWGPSSTEPKYGTKVSLEHMEKMLAWDVDSRMGNTDTRGQFMEVEEFDYTGVNPGILDRLREHMQFWNRQFHYGRQNGISTSLLSSTRAELLSLRTSRDR